MKSAEESFFYVKNPFWFEFCHSLRSKRAHHSTFLANASVPLGNSYSENPMNGDASYKLHVKTVYAWVYECFAQIFYYLLIFFRMHLVQLLRIWNHFITFTLYKKLWRQCLQFLF